jgi:hypothetical protein
VRSIVHRRKVLSASRWQHFAQCLLAFLMPVLSSHAQQTVPIVGYVYPAGGQCGSEFQIVIGGQRLDGATNIYVSGAGIQANVIEHVKPITQGQFNRLRDRIKELQGKKSAVTRKKNERSSSTNTTWTAEDEKEIVEIKKQIAGFLNRPPNPAIAETVRVYITIPTNAEPSTRELRLGTANGLSNPLVFCVGQLPEFSEKIADPSAEPIDYKRLRNYAEQHAVEPGEMSIRIPATMNGRIMPGGRDRFRFNARKGQKLVLVASARQLVPYLPDAVPGWFQATLALYDAKGRELAYDDDFRFHPDPVLHYQIPADGHYTVEIRDAIYRGREDFVYRISIGEIPFITGIFPLGARAYTQTSVELEGWNLPSDHLNQECKGAGSSTVSVRTEQFISNEMPFVAGTLPEGFEREPNNLPQSSEKLTLPITINGRIGEPGDWDIFQVDGRAGDEIVAEVHARRLNSPLDSVLKLIDANGKQLAFNDDHEDKGAGLTTHHADSFLRMTLPASGTYFIHLGDSQQQGGVDYGYRLRISAPRPDFELRVVPSSITVRGGASVPLTIYALRKDGLTNEIELSLKNAPKGFTLSGARVPANIDMVRVTLTAPPTPTKEPMTLSMTGFALVGTEAITRPVVPADDMMQAFAYRHLVPARELKVALSSRYMQRSPVKIVDADPVKIPAGGSATVHVATRMGSYQDRLELKLNEAPEGIALQNVSTSTDGVDIVLRSDAAKVKPGLEGNLIINILARGDRSDLKGKKSTTLGFLPAIPFQVVNQ